MALESSLFPLPSEFVMIPAGILAARGDLSLAFAIFVAGLGSVVGASVNYAIGRFIGKPFIEKYGKYFLINQKKYLLAEGLFDRNANLYTFLGRFIPVVRHLISIPAGIFRMHLVPFWLLTFIGASMWSAVLAVLGYYLGQPIIDLVHFYSHEANIVMAVVIVIGIIWFIRKK